MSITGVLLAFERQILAWSHGRYSVSVPAGTPAASIEKIGHEFDKPGTPPPTITVHSQPSAPVELSFGRDRTLLVDPIQGNLLGQESVQLRTFFSTVERVHRALGGELRNSLGRRVTGVCNFAFLFLVVSGFYLWFPKKYSLQHFRPGLWFKAFEGRARDLNWHKVIGFWCAIPLVFIVLSGVIMSYAWANDLLYRLTGTVPPAAGARGDQPREQVRRNGQHRQQRAGSPLSNFKSPDELLSIAKNMVPDWKSISFRMPAPEEAVMRFSVDSGEGGQPQKRLQLTISRASGELRQQEGFASYNLGRKLRTIARFLHTGEILGLGGQFIAAVASLGGAFLVYTGLALSIRSLVAWYRRKKQGEKQYASAAASSGSR